MNKILGLIVLVVFSLCSYCADKLNDKAFEQCMEAGVQSEETCMFHAYYK